MSCIGQRLLICLTGMAFALRWPMAGRTIRQRHAVEIDEKLPARGVGHWFQRFSQRVADLAGSPWAFVAAVTLIITWLLTGPIFGFSDTWHLLANTVTTLVTTLMVFLIQSTQNRDAKAIHLKLDELLRAVPGARNEFMEAEEEDLDEIVREKQIVDRADPVPPAHKREDRQAPKVSSGNGKARH
jgi:low affinity Fe/Cu permease